MNQAEEHPVDETPEAGPTASRPATEVHAGTGAVPDDAAPVGPDPEPADSEDPEEPEPEGTGFVQVNRRRAPRYRSFVISGIVLALLVSAVLAFVTPPFGGYSQRAFFGYLFVVLGVVGAILGGLVAVLAERRR